ncbi:MAG: hypothetical protein JWR33_1475 [Naasia sp.]|uniref:sensor histidine kinase n=1 Tax=Naasia sp. TaxID=2546198 RepID=UPI0026210171|nr:ATP-binding protein [Naasia sp.]MCU1570734.1 hypothetical protein [Naasia sp.]
MSLGLPGHLAPRAVGAGIARASHVVAAVCLAGAFVVTVIHQTLDVDKAIWPALFALLGMGALLAVVERRRNLLSVSAYLLLGGALIYLFSSVVLVQVPILTNSSVWVLSMLKVALVMVGAVGTRTLGSVLPPLAGYLLGEAATATAAAATGKAVQLDLTAALATLLVLVVGVGTTLGRAAARRAQPSIHRAAMDERVAALRATAEARAAALLHDTILSDLAAIAASTPGPLSPTLANQLQGDLVSIVGHDWSEEPAPSSHLSGPAGVWEASALASAVQTARGLGLDITLSGDPAAVAGLSREVDDALGLAVGQLLINVHKHSGETTAEVVVYAGGGSLSVMVIDGGRGFDERLIDRDRFGLRHSVRSRMAAVGGRVQVWSAPGSGTSVLVQVPAVVSAEDPLVPVPTGEDR